MLMIGLGLGGLGGCATQSKPVTIGDALHELQGQLQAAGAVSATGAGPVRFAAAVRSAQCEAHTANPEVPILTHEITVNLTGSFTTNGGFAVGPAITGGPPFGLSASLTRGQTQELSLPLSFVALSELPDVVASQRAVLFANLPAPVRSAEMRRVIAERDSLRRQTQAVITSFDLRSCGHPMMAQPVGLWQPMTTHSGPAYSGPAYSGPAYSGIVRSGGSHAVAAAHAHHAAPHAVTRARAPARHARCRRAHCRAGIRPAG